MADPPGKPVRIKLIYPPPVKDLVLPYGLGVLAAFLREHGCSVDIEDLSLDLSSPIHPENLFSRGVVPQSIPAIHEYILDRAAAPLTRQLDRLGERAVKGLNIHGYALTGFSVFSRHQIYPALLLAKWIKRANSGARIIFGGAYVTKHWERFFETAVFIDHVSVGAGEPVMLKFLEYLRGDSEVSEVPGLGYRRRGRARLNPVSPFPVENERAPDFSGLALDAYKVSIDGERRLLLPYLLSSGCVHNCHFCALRGPGGRFEVKSLEKIISDLKSLTEKYQTKYINFCDLTLNFSRPFMERFCAALTGADLGLLWGGLGAVDDSDDGLFSRMSGAGCRFLQLGVESGSDALLKRMGKAHTAKGASLALKRAHGAGIRSFVFFVAGYPHETAADVGLTAGFIKDNAAYMDFAVVSTYKLAHGSPMCANPGDFGLCNTRCPEPYLNIDFSRFDEVGGLEWGEKTAQAGHSYRLLYRAVYRKVLSKVYFNGLVPFRLFLFLKERALANGYFPAMLNFLVSLISRTGRGVKHKHDSFSFLYQAPGRAKRTARFFPGL